MATLVVQFDDGLDSVRWHGQMLSRGEAMVVNLDIAEELVMLLFAAGQVQRAEQGCRVRTFRLDAPAVQVIIVGNGEFELHRLPVRRLRLDAKGLVDGEQVVLIVGVDETRGSEQGEKQRNKFLHAAIVAGCGSTGDRKAQRELASGRVCAAIQSRYGAWPAAISTASTSGSSY